MAWTSWVRAGRGARHRNYRATIGPLISRPRTRLKSRLHAVEYAQSSRPKKSSVVIFDANPKAPRKLDVRSLKYLAAWSNCDFTALESQGNPKNEEIL